MATGQIRPESGRRAVPEDGTRRLAAGTAVHLDTLAGSIRDLMRAPCCKLRSITAFRRKSADAVVNGAAL